MHKETAKWLVAFIPVSTMGVTLLAVAPHIDDARRAGIGDWLADNQAATVGLVLVVCSLVAIVWTGSRVLLASADGYSKLRQDGQLFSEAFSQGAVGVPIFLSSTDYDAAVAQLTGDLAAGTPVKDLEGTIGAVESSVKRLGEWSEARNARDRFATFCWAFSVGTAAIVVGVVLAATQLRELPASISTPTKVDVRIRANAVDEFIKATGCTSPGSTQFFAVGGDWEAPTLLMDGPSCADADWSPDRSQAIVVASK